jgi:glycosyltransferase EpsD
MKKKILLTATVQSHISQFHMPLIKMLKDKGYEVHVAAKNNLAEKDGLNLDLADKIFDIPFSRSPLKRENILAYKKIKKIISDYEYEVIHCNTPMGGIITRLAARKARSNGTKVFYTAHGFHFYKGAPIVNWLIYFPIEKYMAHYTDKLITISKEDYQLAINKQFRTNIQHIHGVGASTEKYKCVSFEEKLKLRDYFGYRKDSFICICTGELNRNKNQSVLIKAVPEILEKIPNFKLLLAGNGPLKEELYNLVELLKIEENVDFLGYKTNLDNYVKLSDVAISASIREGLGLNLIEAMLCGKPTVASINRGHNELVKNNITGMLFNPQNSKELASHIHYLYKNRNLIKQFGNDAIEAIRPYRVENVLCEIEELYK